MYGFVLKLSSQFHQSASRIIKGGTKTDDQRARSKSILRTPFCLVDLKRIEFRNSMNSYDCEQKSDSFYSQALDRIGI